MVLISVNDSGCAGTRMKINHHTTSNDETNCLSACLAALACLSQDLGHGTQDKAVGLDADADAAQRVDFRVQVKFARVASGEDWRRLRLPVGGEALFVTRLMSLGYYGVLASRTLKSRKWRRAVRSVVPRQPSWFDAGPGLAPIGVGYGPWHCLPGARYVSLRTCPEGTRGQPLGPYPWRACGRMPRATALPNDKKCTELPSLFALHAQAHESPVAAGRITPCFLPHHLKT